MTEVKIFKVVSKPEGEPTFIDSTGVQRPYMRQTVVGAENEKIASKMVEAINWDCHISGADGDLIYEVVSVIEE